MARNYNNGRLVTVKLGGFPELRYGFKTRVKETTSTDLGHVKITPSGITDIKGIVIGANSPKPPRASLRTEEGVESSYIDVKSIEEAKKKGYKISRGKIRRGNTTKFAKTKYIEMNGIKYAWSAPNAKQEPSSLSKAGLKDAKQDDLLVFGASFPKPPRMKIELEVGSYSTFVDPQKVNDLADAGWVRAGDGFFAVADFKNI